MAASAKLERVGTRPPIKRYLTDVYKRRAFAFTFSKYTLQASTAKSRLGVAWHVVVPALQITVYGLIFGLVLGSSRPNHFLPFLITGIVLFQFISAAFSDGAKSIINNASLVRCRVLGVVSSRCSMRLGRESLGLRLRQKSTWLLRLQVSREGHPSLV